jgi:hypothetical protein
VLERGERIQILSWIYEGPTATTEQA